MGPHPLPLVALLLVASCGGGGGSAPPAASPVPAQPDVFQFSSSSEVELALTVTLDGAPAVGADVQVVEAIAEPGLPAGAVLLAGSTGADGVCRGLIKLDSVHDEVDVVVQVPGADGPYTHPELRLEWGPFAPSARVTLALEDLDGATVALEGSAGW
jgi:hypothetical protein